MLHLPQSFHRVITAVAASAGDQLTFATGHSDHEAIIYLKVLIFCLISICVYRPIRLPFGDRTKSTWSRR